MTDLDKLQGTWNVTALEVEGAPMPSPAAARIVIAGTRFQSLGMGAVYEGTVELNTRTKPKHFDLLFTEGPERGNRSLGIYRLEGDEWQLCLTLRGTARPTAFATAPGSGHALESLRRAAEATAVPTPAAAAAAAAAGPAAASEPAPGGDSAPELEGEWRMTACIANGLTLPDSMMRTGRRVAHGGVTSTYFGDQRIMQARYTVDRGTTPCTIDYTLANGLRQFGIWKFEGETLRICFAAPGDPRPADFEGREGQTSTAWRRTGN